MLIGLQSCVKKNSGNGCKTTSCAGEQVGVLQQEGFNQNRGAFVAIRKGTRTAHGGEETDDCYNGPVLVSQFMF